MSLFSPLAVPPAGRTHCYITSSQRILSTLYKVDQTRHSGAQWVWDIGACCDAGTLIKKRRRLIRLVLGSETVNANELVETEAKARLRWFTRRLRKCDGENK